MEMSKEQKIEFQKFAAQYWGQEVLMYENSKGDKHWEKQVYPVDGHNITCALMQLHLRGIDSLTDDEAIKTSQIGFNFFKECFPGGGYKLKVVRELNKISVAAVSDDEKTCLAKIEVNNVSKLNYWQIMYLLSIGTCLDETAVTKGYCVIREDGV